MPQIKVRTNSRAWINSDTNIIVPVSIHSAFHQGALGIQKMHAMISYIVSHAKNVTIVLTDRAHIHTLSLTYENDLKKAFDICRADAFALAQNFASLFASCKIVYWDDIISDKIKYECYKQQLNQLYEQDSFFCALLQNDAEKTFTSNRAQIFPDKEIYVEKAKTDIIEQTAFHLILAYEGYRFMLYPGRTYQAITYAQHIFLPAENRITHVNINIKINNKHS